MSTVIVNITVIWYLSGCCDVHFIGRDSINNNRPAHWIGSDITKVSTAGWSFMWHRLNKCDEVDGLKRYILVIVILLHETISVFFQFNWDQKMFAEQFIVGFNVHFIKISTLQLSEELKGRFLLKLSDLIIHDRNVVVRVPVATTHYKR